MLSTSTFYQVQKQQRKKDYFPQAFLVGFISSEFDRTHKIVDDPPSGLSMQGTEATKN